MPDDIQINAGSGPAVATEDKAGRHVQVVSVDMGNNATVGDPEDLGRLLRELVMLQRQLVSSLGRTTTNLTGGLRVDLASTNTFNSSTGLSVYTASFGSPVGARGVGFSEPNVGWLLSSIAQAIESNRTAFRTIRSYISVT